MTAASPTDELHLRSLIFAALTAVLLTGAYFAFVGDINFNPTEEGYLWYGTLKTAAGGVPIRDVQSYDPGRYYWCAWLGKLFGDGLLGLRRSVACFQALGMFFGLLAARRALKSDWLMIPTGLLMLAWMFPRHKLFESAIALSAVFFAVRLLEKPTRRRHFEAGVFVGIAGLFGRNHAVYCALGIFVLGAVVAWKQRAALGRADAPRPASRFLAYSGGVLVGYAPILLMLVFVPGFSAAFVESILHLLKLGSNIPYPWPWPWKYDWSERSAIELWENLGSGLWFTLPLLLLPLGVVTLLLTPAERLRQRAVFLAGSVLGLFYIHHASVRSDPSHFAQSIDPLLIATVGLPAAFPRVVINARPRLQAVIWALFALLTLGSVSANHQLLSRRQFAQREALTEYRVAGDTLRIPWPLAAYYTALERTLARHVPADAEIFFGPSRPAFYGIFDKVAPTWWIYFFIPDLEDDSQRTVLADLENVDWALLVDVPIANQERFLFRNTCPLVWQAFVEEFERVPTPKLPANHLLMHRKDNTR